MLGLAAVKDVLRVSPSVRQFSPRRAGSSVKHWKKTVNEKGKSDEITVDEGCKGKEL